ncbi:hypothetical protein, partial [Pseudomonas aeruginosa]|uniref:hypothetical protein n=1 Tax=Pseudomonas aeruginosa TaxID=287 RepID=UPI0034C62070
FLAGSHCWPTTGSQGEGLPALGAGGRGGYGASWGGSVGSGAGGIRNTYSSIKEAPKYPQGFKDIKNGTQKYKINNQDVLESLRGVEPGKWVKVYRDGFDSAGNKISVHYFQSQSGKVFDVKVKSGWSN